ncbi:MAG TPA: ester cyclase [Propionibacteriaceae bacterium]|jgi:predicted ester cyclase|nr:ester cyclase [Propionibacteriaceae bacterium]
MTEELKAKARRIWEEIFPSGDVDRLAEVIAEDSIDHGARPDERQGLAGVQQTMLWLRSVFSEQRWEIRQVIGEGEFVVVYCTLHARHTGDLMGIPPTNREVAMDYVQILRFEDGKAVERWGVRDDMALMRQLGVLAGRPEPVAAS